MYFYFFQFVNVDVEILREFVMLVLVMFFYICVDYEDVEVGDRVVEMDW